MVKVRFSAFFVFLMLGAVRVSKLATVPPAVNRVENVRRLNDNNRIDFSGSASPENVSIINADESCLELIPESLLFSSEETSDWELRGYSTYMADILSATEFCRRGFWSI